jgi:hypothetical protein
MDLDPKTLLRRRPAAAALTAAGYPIAPSTLASLVSLGGGPFFRRFGRVPLYRWADLLDWAQSRLSAPMRSTSERDAVRPAQRTAPPRRRALRPDGTGYARAPEAS